MTRLLLVDDDERLLRALALNLTAHGHAVTTAATGRAALARAAEAPPELVILDLGLPDLDGREVIRSLRSWSDAPIIVLSGRSGGQDKVDALDAGADDYVTKPFGVPELLARIRAVSRRSGPGDRAPVRLGSVVVDVAARTCMRVDAGGVREEEIHLTPTEWHLLEAFCRAPGRLLSQAQLLAEAWGSAAYNQPSNLRLYMTQLRRKLEPDPSRPRYLLTVPGMGYRFTPDG